MVSLFDYLGYCFYQLASVKQPDRVGTSRLLLSLFGLFAFMNIYLVCSLLLGIRPSFFAAGIGCFILAELAVRAYARRPDYQERLASYAEPEPDRLRLALAGVGALLLVFFLPFLWLRLAMPIR
jgi:hypothetical protein